jgi:YD repeat-containing protein
MAMADRELEKLLQDRVVRRVDPDGPTARVELSTARAHLETAATVASTDPNGAFQLAYDAARKAIAAHMRANGYRVGSGASAHVKTGQYAGAALDAEALAPHLDAFDDLRALRNQSEYDALLLDEADARDALDHARAIVDAVERDLR